jgi:hypothetical protein
MALSRSLSRSWLGFATALLIAPAAGALDITGLSITATGTNTANVLQNTGSNPTQIASATSIVIAPSGPVADTIGSSLSFQTRYASSLTGDRNAGAGTFTQNQTSDYTITFTVDNPTGATYQVSIDTLRVGALTLIDDSGGNGSATLGALTGSVDSIVNGSLALAALGPIASATSGTTTFSQSGTTVTISDNALSRTFTLAFNWADSVTSAQDEASIRMGVDGGVTSATADNYSLDGRTLSGDGHFVSVTTQIVSAPEPAPVALVALGLVALALRGRRARS